MSERVELAPQAGPQTAFLNAEETIVFYGGAAGKVKNFHCLPTE